MMNNSVEISSMPMEMPDFIGMAYTGNALPSKEANAVRLLASVLMRMPNQATPYEPAIPISEKTRMITTSAAERCCTRPKYAMMITAMKHSRNIRNLPWRII